TRSLALLLFPTRRSSDLLREAISKHIAAIPKDVGFVSVFNGENLDGWKGLVANPIRRAAMDEETLAAAQIKADEIMRGGWYVARSEEHTSELQSRENLVC